MCAKCIKTCENSSVQLNIRLAPQELWALETPRRADSFLIVSMGAIFFPFALHSEFSRLITGVVSAIAKAGVTLPDYLIGSVLFFAAIFVFQLGYFLMVVVQSWYAKMDRNLLLPLLGYGFIPLILGGYMSLHLEFFIAGAGRIWPNLRGLFGYTPSYENIRLISSDSTYVLQFLTVMGGLLASLYATYRVLKRGMLGDSVSSKGLVIPFSFLVILAGLFTFMV